MEIGVFANMIQQHPIYSRITDLQFIILLLQDKIHEILALRLVDVVRVRICTA